MKTLWNIKLNEKIKISGFDQSMDELTKIRLIELGFNQDEEVVCINETMFKGPKTYKVSDSIFSLDSHLANLITVKEN